MLGGLAVGIIMIVVGMGAYAGQGKRIYGVTGLSDRQLGLVFIVAGAALVVVGVVHVVSR